MKTNYLLLLIFFLSINVLSCYQRQDLPPEPSLEFIGMDKNSIKQGFSKEDSIVIYLNLRDGDGDIGVSSSDTISKSIFIKDMRTGNISEQFNIPEIPENISVNGISAELQLKLYTTCCLFPDNIPPCSVISEYPIDTIVYEITIRDRAGNTSTPIQTPPIFILCE